MTRTSITLPLLLMASTLLAGCSFNHTSRMPDVSAAAKADLPAAAAPAPVAAVPPQVSDALAEPAPAPVKPAPEPRIDLLVNNAQAREVFLAIVADTRYSMLMHPDVSGTLSVTLRGVTVQEALESIRDVYGYDFKIEGRRITIYAPTLQTRIFTVNYPTSQRSGNSELRVSSGGQSSSSGTGGAAGNVAGGAAPVSTMQANESSKVSTSSRSDFWSELTGAVKGIVGSGEGRNVIASPQAGIMAVRAMPEELRQVDKFLKAAQISVERQVMLEAKVVEVELRDGYQSGIDWSALRSRGATGAFGVLSGNTTTNTLVDGVRKGLPGFSNTGAALAADAVGLPGAGGGLFGLALATDGFQAVLGFLETQGDVQTLSSPRIATLNNQKAVLKVGTDAFFVTNVSGGSAASATGTTSTGTITMPNITLTPFFSGISLDVTPQVDDGVNITLHVHPSVTTVTETSKQIDLGTIGNYKLPLASSSVNETDTLVRIQDGRIVAIGGLMQMDSSSSVSGFPGSTQSAWAPLLGNKAQQGRKREVIVLIKPTIIRSASDWDEQNRRARAALEDMEEARARVIKLDGPVAK